MLLAICRLNKSLTSLVKEWSMDGTVFRQKSSTQNQLTASRTPTTATTAKIWTTEADQLPVHQPTSTSNWLACIMLGDLKTIYGRPNITSALSVCAILRFLQPDNRKFYAVSLCAPSEQAIDQSIASNGKPRGRVSLGLRVRATVRLALGTNWL